MVENVIKRNGTVVAYNRDKIEKAIASAVRDIQDTNIEEISKKAAEKTEKNLNDQIKDSSPNVEDIQDIVENTLIELNYPKIAKEYIIYRNKRNKTRDKRNKKSILTEEFLSQYKHKPNPFPTELGEFIYYRTYSRWLPEEGRREYWWETVKRAVEYNCSLAPTTIEEAEKLFDNVYHFRQFLSGRTLWTGGTEASRKYPMSNYNCFTGDTEFITNKGIKSFENFEDGEKVNILDGYSSFTEAEVKNFGEKDIYELVVNKGRSEKTYKVTDDHIWFVRRTPKEKKYREVQTKDLSMGDIFREKKAFREKNTPNICNVGIQHGIVFGDGTYDKNKNHCRISLIGEKQELLEYFTTGTTCTEGDRDSTLVYGLPYDWKEMPSVEANPEYILGFIVGYIATDGSVSSSVKISSSSKENLRKLRDLAVTIGINSYDIKDRRRTTNNFGEGELYELTFDKRDIETSMILRSSHSANFSKGDIETAWKVKSIRSLNRKEETWCVTGSRTDSFTLDTGIHTHNCSFTVIDSYKAFEDLFYLLLIGSGVGVRVLEEDIEKLAPIRTNVRVRHNYYEPVAKDQREEFTNYVFDGETDVTIHVGDSKEGWVQALKIFFELLTRHEYRNLESIYFNYNSVRPKGERLKTFGGHASGHQSLKKMFDKIDAYLLKPKKENRVNLTALDCLDIANIVGENVVSGGVRRTSEVGLFDVDNEKIKTAKNELYTQKEGEWKINKKIEHRQMSNNSIYYQEKPTREQLHWHVEQMRYSGEPGFANAEVGKSRRDNFEGANPCFTGDMKLLTQDGYKRFDELAKLNTRVSVVNKDGEVTSGNVWSNGIKDTVEVKFYNKESIKCTADHTFMTNEGLEVEAKDMKGERIMPFIDKETVFNNQFVKLGFMQGDANLGRFNSNKHKGIDVHIGEGDSELLELFGVTKGDAYSDGYTYYINELNDVIDTLGFSTESLPDRVLPTTFRVWNKANKYSFIRGLYSANGSVIGASGNGRIALKSTSKELIEGVYDFLNSQGFSPYITTNKPTNVEFDNGEYTCKQSYDLNLGQYDDKVKFLEEVGFAQKYKEEKLLKFIRLTAPYITSVKRLGKEEVFDFSEPKTHWGVVEGAVVHNCMEILLDSKGVCNLVSLNVMGFVKEDGSLDKEGMFESQRLNARSSYRMALVEFELPKWDYINKRDRLIGLSLTGWQDMANAAGLTKEEESELLRQLREVAHEAAEKVANEYNDNEPVLITTVKPEGTQTQMPTVSSGLHYSHSPYYFRRVRINADDPLIKVAEDLEWNVYPEVGQTEEDCTTKVVEFPVKAPKGKVKGDVSAIEQLETYKMFMENYVDHNASITVHVRDDEWGEVEEWLWNNWDYVFGVSFLSYDDSFYQLMPYEEVNKEDYEELATKMKTFKPSLVNKYELEKNEERQLAGSSCDTGVCAIR